MEILKVLVVDDEAGIRSGVKRVIEKFTVDFPFMDDDFNFEIIEAATGEEAIEIVDKTPPDIVLLDNKLPGIEGIEVLEYINQKKSDILVMMITSHASLDLAVKATRLGAYDFISKPFTPQELRSSMENVTKHLYLLRMTRKMTEAGKQVRFQFLSMLSHELKAPINSIEGYLRMMQEKQYGESIDDYQTIIERTVQRVKGMRHLIMDLLDLTRLESTEKARELRKVNIVDMAQISIDTLKPFAMQKEIKLNLQSEGNVILKADAKEIEIIFNNLISNAIKYNKNGGEVFISIIGTNEKITIEVRDTGIGMKEDDIARLFKEFFRIKTAQTKNINGSGLGLSILKRISDMYQGTINVSSQIDQGSTFTIELPVHVEDSSYEPQ